MSGFQVAIAYQSRGILQAEQQGWTHPLCVTMIDTETQGMLVAREKPHFELLGANRPTRDFFILLSSAQSQSQR